MFNRLCALLLLTIATASVSTPARAATLSVTYMDCTATGVAPGYGNAYTFTCWADVSGGTGSYTSFSWYMSPTYFTTTENHFEHICQAGVRRTISLTVTDSAGATASAHTFLYCDFR